MKIKNDAFNLFLAKNSISFKRKNNEQHQHYQLYNFKPGTNLTLLLFIYLFICFVIDYKSCVL